MTTALETGRLVTLTHDVRRLVAPNPGMMTGPGTNTYLVGTREIAVIDPGPAVESHLQAIVGGAGGTVRWILVTHTHSDHSPGAALLGRATGAELLGRSPPAGRHQDPSFNPDRVLGDGDRLTTADFELEAIHTPGHASNHLCYLLGDRRWLFTGDHIIDGSTVVIDPPDGNMGEYLRSLKTLRERDIEAIAPGHGNLMHDPRAVIDRLIEHRLQREAKVVRALVAHPGSTPTSLVRRVYDDVDPSRHAWAERSLLAHLEKLEADSRAQRRGAKWWPVA